MGNVGFQVRKTVLICEGDCNDVSSILTKVTCTFGVTTGDLSQNGNWIRYNSGHSITAHYVPILSPLTCRVV
jgi:hypothetical protein